MNNMNYSCRKVLTRSAQEASIHVIEKIKTFIEEDTRNIVQRIMTLQSPSKQAPWDLT